MNNVGRRQIVEREAETKLSVRLVENGVSLPLDSLPSHTVQISTPGKSILVPTTTVGLSLDPSDNAVLLYSQTWGSQFTLRFGYKAEFALFSSGTLYRRVVRFDVVRRIFNSQLSDQDIFAMYPFLEDQLPTGITTMLIWRQLAWKHIEEIIRRRWPKVVQRFGREYNDTNQPLPYPGEFFYPEDFFDAHLELTAAFFSRAIAFSASPESEDWMRAGITMERGEHLVEQVLANCEVDLTGDDTYSTKKTGLSFGVEVIR